MLAIFPRFIFSLQHTGDLDAVKRHQHCHELTEKRVSKTGPAVVYFSTLLTGLHSSTVLKQDAMLSQGGPRDALYISKSGK